MVKTKIKAKSKAKAKSKLTLEQEAFCKTYVCADKEFFGNGVQCYIAVYWPDTSKPNWYKNACSAASQILSNTKVTTRINELLEKWWLNDENIDKQLLFLISQFTDFWNKLWAIKEYNKLKERISNKEVDININVKEMSWEDLLALIKKN